MKRLFLASCAALLVLAPVLALAQRTPPAGSTTVGSAAPRGGDSGGSSSSGSTNSGGGSGSVGSSGSSGGSGGMSSPVGSAGPRYEGARSGESSPGARVRTGANVGQPVPASERPRGDSPTYGQAVPRGTVPPPNNGGGNGGNGGIWYPSYPYYPYWSYGYYDPFYYGSYFYSWMYDPCAWDPSCGGGMGGAFYSSAETGSIKLKVRPKEAEVYIDNTYYGHVDDYDGTFQHLDLRPGTHRLEIRAEGYVSISEDVRILPGKTITYSGELKPIK